MEREVKMESRENPDRFASRLFLNDSPLQRSPETARSLEPQTIELPDTRFRRIVRDRILLEHRQHYLANEVPECPTVKTGLVINVGQPFQVDRWIDGKLHQESIQSGDFTILPAGVDYRVAWDRPVELFMVGFDRSLIQQTVSEFNDSEKQSIPWRDCIGLLPHHKIHDPLIYQLGMALKNQLHTDRALDRLYTESMLNALLVHLLRSYTSPSYLAPLAIGGLPKLQLQLAIEYIHAHLSQDISLAELATIAQMGSRHFSRCFKQSTGLSPYQYLIKCRVDRAKELLQQKNSSIAQTAQTVGFANQSHLNRHFKRWLGVSPRSVQQR
jgi:AraC family transcriptional regulator